MLKANRVRMANAPYLAEYAQRVIAEHHARQQVSPYQPPPRPGEMWEDEDGEEMEIIFIPDKSH